MTQVAALGCVRSAPDGVLLELRVVPRASKAGPLGVHAERLKWGVHAAAQDGEANAELTQAVAKLFRVAKGSVTILRGEKSREKTLHIFAITLECAQAALVDVV